MFISLKTTSDVLQSARVTATISGKRELNRHLVSNSEQSLHPLLPYNYYIIVHPQYLISFDSIYLTRVLSNIKYMQIFIRYHSICVTRLKSVPRVDALGLSSSIYNVKKNKMATG